MNTIKKPILISIVGPTAVGKTALAIELAKELSTEIISADSRQFYRELNIGTAKPSKTELSEIRHHFINNLSIEEDYNASDFENEVLLFLKDFFRTKDIVLLCGGSGMYIDAVINGFDQGVPTSDDFIRKELNQKLETEGIESLQEQLKILDPIFYQEIDLKNSKRLLRAIEVCLITKKPFSAIRKNIRKKRSFDVIKIGLNQSREELYERINSRVDLMIQNGLVEEAKSVENFKSKNALNTVGYKELFDCFEAKTTLEEAIEKIKVNSRRYAKRQLTWFKKDTKIEWFQAEEKAKIIEYIRSRIK